MRQIVPIFALSFMIVACVHAQALQEQDGGQLKGSSEGAVACKTEQAMVTLMKADLPNGITNKTVLNGLVKSGDCVIMPRDWLVLGGKDPSPDQRGDHASLWTIRTPQGIIHMWGWPLGDD
jgi:hypothetical protein